MNIRKRPRKVDLKKKPVKYITDPCTIGSCFYGVVDFQQMKLSKVVARSVNHIETLNTLYRIKFTCQHAKDYYLSIKQ